MRRFDNQDGSLLALAAVAAVAGAGAVVARRRRAGSMAQVQVFDDQGKSYTYGPVGVSPGGATLFHVANPTEWSYKAVDWRGLNFGGSLFRIEFGATNIAVWADHLESALEEAAEYARERKWFGIAHPHDQVWAQAVAAFQGDVPEGEEARNQAIHQLIDESYYYTESGYILSHEWYGTEITDPVVWLEVLYASIMVDPENGSDEGQQQVLGAAIAAGLQSGNRELAKRYGTMMRQMAPAVRVAADTAMQRGQ